MHIAITGASSGIGRALAHAFATVPNVLTLVARREAELQALAAELGAPSFVAAQDLASPPHAADWMASAVAKHGPIDVLINCAGVMDVGATASFDTRLGQRMMDLDLLSPMMLVQGALPGMLQRGHGAIINVTSLAGLVPVPGATWYSAAKAGLGAYSEGLRAELRGTGVRVLTVYPGPVDTPLAQASLDAYGETGAVRWMPRGTPDGLARRVRVALERGQARVIYPLPYVLAYWFPRLSLWLAARGTPRLPAGKTFTLPPAGPPQT